MDNVTKLYADDLPYWKTGQSSPDVWLDNAKEEIRRAKGKVITEAFASTDGKQAYMLSFSFGQDTYTIHWPVLNCKSGKDVDKRAAKIQAATMLYHDVKSRCVSARVMGIRSAFMGYLQLANGQTASQVSNDEYLMLAPPVLMLSSGQSVK